MRNIKNRRLFTSYVSITVIMSIVLFLFGFFGIFFISSNSIANSFKENFSVSIFFKENAKKIEIIQLQNELLMSSYIQELKYISKDDALLIMKEECVMLSASILYMNLDISGWRNTWKVSIAMLKLLKCCVMRSSIFLNP